MKKRFRDEYVGAELGDTRRSDRLAELGMALAALPASSFPEALGDGAALEAAYRFLSNDAVDPDGILQPHYRETAARCEQREDVVVAHDTSDFVFKGEHRRGLGRLRRRVERGFFAHLALAVTWDERREPLGALHLDVWIRGPKAKKRETAYHRRRNPENESKRWFRGVEEVEGHLSGHRAIHVMDREADAYDLMAGMIETDRRFVIRASSDRRLATGEMIMDAGKEQSVVATREVPVCERGPRHFALARKLYPPRTARPATLGIKAIPVVLKTKDAPPGVPRTLDVNLVIVEEIDTPDGEPPVSWRLFTTEPIATAAELERVVDAYHCRWRIEEYFKVIKTGCAIEKRQLETREALANALAIYIPIAWRVLRHRTLAQLDGDQPASRALSAVELRVLRRISRTALGRSPTVATALTAIAAVGGHLKRNGPPGWITLARGYERLLTLVEGVSLAAEM
jgi:hypothetical protein